ncbi:MAG: S-layer family protein [Cyanobacteria bacterium J06621_11]
MNMPAPKIGDWKQPTDTAPIFGQLSGQSSQLTSWQGMGWGMSALLLLDAAVVASPALAQIAGDGSLGTLVNQSERGICALTQCTITGGTLNSASSTLFHSFEQFSLPGNPGGNLGPQSALFVDPGVNDIIVRVTGDRSSLINGLLSTSIGSSANLFLLNAQGISLGPNAQLDLGGNFTASTANEILFDRDIAIATDTATPATPALLTVSSPIGLGFLPSGSNVASNAAITVQGTGNLLTTGSPTSPDPFVNRLFRNPAGLPPNFPPLPPLSELAVQPAQEISLIGNGVDISGGNLTAAGGQINLGSIASGQVFLRPETGKDSGFDYTQVEQFSDITLINRSALEASSAQSGSVSVQGRNITLDNGSVILAETLPTASANETTTGGQINLTASEQITLTDNSRDDPFLGAPPFLSIASQLSVDVAPGASGPGGEVNLSADNLTINNGGKISATTFGSGNAGRINVATLDQINLIGGGAIGPSGIFSVSESSATGNAGLIDIETENLDLQRGAGIVTSSRSPGASGSILIDASRVSLDGTTDAIEIPLPDGSTRTIFEPTSLQADLGPISSRQGGDIDIDADIVSVTGGAEITSATNGPGSAGSINISSTDDPSKSVTVSGFSPFAGPSLIATTTRSPVASGSGGNLTIATDRLSVLDNGQISTGTIGPGDAGDLIINSESTLISGKTALGRSGLFATAIADTGNSGSITLTTESLDVLEGGTLSVGNFPSVANSPFPPGRGSSGDLTINAEQVLLTNQAVLNADTAAGDRGNINIQTDLLTLRTGSQITTNAIGTATGGNININAENGFVVAVPQENSDITANAVRGDGGQVNITAQDVFGIEPSAELTPNSDITASSEFGIAGETQLTTPDIELRDQTVPLPASTEIPAVATGCANSSSRFVQTGRGGVPANPYGILNSRNALVDVSLPVSLSNEMSNSSVDNGEVEVPLSTSNPSVISEAKGWAYNPQGDVVLVSENIDQAAGERCLSWHS